MAQLVKLIEKLPLPLVPPNLKIGREIGRGAWGAVHEGQLEGTSVAVKKIHYALENSENRGNVVDSFFDECERLKGLDHPHVIKFRGAFKDAELGPILVMERMNENLRIFLQENKGKLTIEEQIRISHEITQGVAFLHQLTPPMLHRDLSDKNVMFTFDGVAKIGDFGQSKLKKGLYLTTIMPGMVPFMPPEALVDGNPKYDESLDIFSLGVLMLEIGIQQQPMTSLLGIGSIPEIKRRERDLQMMDDLHPLKPFILICLSNDPRQRPTAAEMCTVLSRLKKDILQTILATERIFVRLEDEVNKHIQQNASLQAVHDTVMKDVKERTIHEKDMESQSQIRLECTTEVSSGHLLQRQILELQAKCNCLEQELSLQRSLTVEREKQLKDIEETECCNCSVLLGKIEELQAVLDLTKFDIERKEQNERMWREYAMRKDQSSGQSTPASEARSKRYNASSAPAVFHSSSYPMSAMLSRVDEVGMISGGNPATEMFPQHVPPLKDAVSMDTVLGGTHQSSTHTSTVFPTPLSSITQSTPMVTSSELLVCTPHSRPTPAEFLDQCRQQFVEKVEVTAIVLELEHQGIISDGDRKTIRQEVNATVQTQLLHACLKEKCNTKALTDVCDIISMVKGNPRMKSFGEYMKTEWEKNMD